MGAMEDMLESPRVFPPILPASTLERGHEPFEECRSRTKQVRRLRCEATSLTPTPCACKLNVCEACEAMNMMNPGWMANMNPQQQQQCLPQIARFWPFVGLCFCQAYDAADDAATDGSASSTRRRELEGLRG